MRSTKKSILCPLSTFTMAAVASCLEFGSSFKHLRCYSLWSTFTWLVQNGQKSKTCFVRVVVEIHFFVTGCQQKKTCNSCLKYRPWHLNDFVHPALQFIFQVWLLTSRRWQYPQLDAIQLMSIVGVATRIMVKVDKGTLHTTPLAGTSSKCQNQGTVYIKVNPTIMCARIRVCVSIKTCWFCVTALNLMSRGNNFFFQI